MGVERYLDFYLRGQDGWREIERDGRKRELAQFRTREIPPTNGYNVVLSIDSFVQHCIEGELREIVREFNPIGATIIVSEPQTGFLLGLANYPSFDLNNFNKADLSSQRNIAITDIFEPGSTFKIVAASAALNEGMVTPESRFDCSDETLEYNGYVMRLPRDTHSNGILEVSEIVAKSSNRGAAHLGVLLGADRMYRYCAAYGFGQPTGFALTGEVAGMLHPVKSWDGLTMSRLPMGHAVGVTPLQIHYAMATIANDGVLMRPQVVRRIADQDGGTIVEYSPIARRRVIRADTAKLVAHLLTRVVSSEGTAPKAAIDGFEVAGKTGTTQKIIDGHYSTTHHVGSFVGFFPASKPRLAISVIIDDARLNGIAYGSTVAAPTFKSIAEQLTQYLGISPTEAINAAPKVAGTNLDPPSHRDQLR
jgi:cell division protein FtsI/penicillin-binding protein 2